MTMEEEEEEEGGAVERCRHHAINFKLKKTNNNYISMVTDTVGGAECGVVLHTTPRVSH